MAGSRLAQQQVVTSRAEFKLKKFVAQDLRASPPKAIEGTAVKITPALQQPHGACNVARRVA